MSVISNELAYLAHVDRQLIQTPNLESSLKEQITKIDLTCQCFFELFLNPNEGHPEAIESHIKMAKRGVIVSTGTERSFFNLLHCNENCMGLVNVDINSKVKAYGDFNVLLLRIAKDRKDYENLSTINDINRTSSFEDTSSSICDKLEKNQLEKRIEDDTLLSREMKEYYLYHLKDIAYVYYAEVDDQFWKFGGAFAKVLYDLNDDQFCRLQKFAREGNIVFTVGDMNNLSFLKGYPIAAVDTSNISDYGLLSLDVPDGTPVINTKPSYDKTIYFCHFYEHLTPEENIEFDKLLQTIKTVRGVRNEDQHEVTGLDRIALFVKSASSGYGFRSKQVLLNMREYFENYVLKIEDGEVLALPDRRCKALSSLNYNYSLFTLPNDQIAGLCKNSKVQRHLKEIVASWEKADLRGYLAFSQMEGWKEAFIANFKNSISDFRDFLERLKEQNQLDTLKEKLTPDDLHVLPLIA